MAKISVLQLPPELDELYHKALQPGDRFTYSRITKKNALLSRKRKKGLSQKTLLPQITALWNTLSEAEKGAWEDAGKISSSHGFKLFVQDTSKRIINDIEGIATPSLDHQANVGIIQIDAPATKIRLVQIHPCSYYVLKKVTGTKSMYEPKKISEFFQLPFKIGMSYKSQLTTTGANSYANLIAIITSSYQGEDRYTQLEMPIDFVSDWQTDEATISTLLGYFIGYDLYLELNDLNGTLLFDNVIAEHTSQNWARDPFCNRVDTTFTKAFYQIPRNWVALEIPDGATYETTYPED